MSSKDKGVICPLSVDVPIICKDHYLPNRFSIRADIRKSLNFSDQDKVLLYFGKITHFKRTLETAKAFAKVKPKGWKLLIMGHSDPKELDLLKDLEYLASNNHNLKLIPPIFENEKWKYILASDLFILFSRRENFGFTVAECSILGVPVYISKDVDIYTSFLSNNLPKMIFDITSTYDIENAISLLKDIKHEELTMMGQFCQEGIVRNFNFQNFRLRLCTALNHQ